MAYDEILTNRVREALSRQPIVDEVKMFQGVCFMVDDKMCICIRDQDLLCRIGKEQAAIELEKDNCRQMMHGNRVMKDFVYVDMENLQTNQDFDHWIKLSLQFNKVAKASKKGKKA
jgi:TfoX/Sxy family transcriptional regulator of competence genes